MLATDFFLRIFRFHCFSRAATSENWQNLFLILSLHGFSLKRLCSRQVPHVGSHPNSLYPEISDLSILVKDLRPLEASGRFWEGQGCSSTAYSSKIKPLGIHKLSPVSPQIFRKRCHQPQVGTPLLHAPGVRMT